MQFGARSSWGANALLGDDGLQHMFVAEIPGGLRTWGSHSQCVHATSPNISGPYSRHDLVLGHECHNPSTLRHPKTGEWLMFHIVSTDKLASIFQALYMTQRLLPGSGSTRRKRRNAGAELPAHRKESERALDCRGNSTQVLQQSCTSLPPKRNSLRRMQPSRHHRRDRRLYWHMDSAAQHGSPWEKQPRWKLGGSVPTFSRQ